MEIRDRNIFTILVFSIFATTVGVGIVVPLLPVYASDMGASGFYISLIFGAFAVSRTIFLPYFGRLSDRRGRKPFIVFGLFAYAAVSVAFMFSDTIQGLIIIRFIQGIASAMIMPVIQAYVGDLTPDGSEGLSMGVFNMSVFWGLSLGPLMGGVIEERFSLDAAFAAMGFLALLGALLSSLSLPPTQKEPGARMDRQPTPWGRLLADRELSALFLFRAGYTACIGALWGFLPVFAADEFSMDSSAIGVLVMLGVFVSGLVHTPMGWLADRVDKKVMVVTGGIIVCGAMIAFEWARGFWDLVFINLFFGLGGGTAMSALTALSVIKGNRIRAMGAVMSMLTMGHSLGMMTGALMAGAMLDHFNLRHAFGAGSLLMAGGIAAILVFLKSPAPVPAGR